MLAAGGTSDHVHLLASIDKNLTIPDVIRTIKSSSTNWVRKKIKNKKYFSWQNGYASFSVGRSQVEQIERYIRNQRKHHRKIDFEEELKLFLDKYGIPYEERYLKE